MIRTSPSQGRGGNRKALAQLSDRGAAVLQFACPYCNGMFQVDPSMAGGEAMCPMCHGVVAVPTDPNAAPPAADAPPAVPEEFDFGRKRRGGMFAGLDEPQPAPESPPDQAFPDQAFPDAGLFSMGCPHCGAPFQVDGSLAGQQAMCPTCQGLVVIPDMYAAGPNDAPPMPHHAPPRNKYAVQPSEYAVPPVPQSAPPPSPPTQLSPMPTGVVVNPLPPGFDAPSAAAHRSPPPSVSPLTPPSAPPLSARATPTTDVPLSARQKSSEPPLAATNAPQLRPAASPILPGEAAAPASDSPAAAIEPGEPDKPTKKTPSERARTRAEKVESMLPEQADPDEEVVAERPIAVEEPPDSGIAGLIVDAPDEPTFTDAEGQPIRRLTADERARLRRIRTILLFGVGMLVLILAVVLLPRMGFLIDIGKTPPQIPHKKPSPSNSETP